MYLFERVIADRIILLDAEASILFERFKWEIKGILNKLNRGQTECERLFLCNELLILCNKKNVFSFLIASSSKNVDRK
jgi:hypothetical protein